MPVCSTQQMRFLLLPLDVAYLIVQIVVLPCKRTIYIHSYVMYNIYAQARQLLVEVVELYQETSTFHTPPDLTTSLVQADLASQLMHFGQGQHQRSL